MLSKALFFPYLRNFTLVYAILLWFHIALKSSENTNSSTFICRLYSVKEARPKRKHRKRYKEEKARTFCFRENKYSSFVCYWSESYYALFLGCFDLKCLPDIPYCVYWVVAEIWASNSLHEIFNEYFIHHCHNWKEGSILCETIWSFSNWIHVNFCWNLPRFVPNSIQILS